MAKWLYRLLLVVVFLWFCISLGFGIAALIVTNGDYAAGLMTAAFWWIILTVRWGR